ncbi:hypothetical protein SARC_08521, partial [Sphaeroforma arctica JP610]
GTVLHVFDLFKPKNRTTDVDKQAAPKVAKEVQQVQQNVKQATDAEKKKDAQADKREDKVEIPETKQKASKPKKAAEKEDAKSVFGNVMSFGSKAVNSGVGAATKGVGVATGAVTSGYDVASKAVGTGVNAVGTGVKSVGGDTVSIATEMGQKSMDLAASSTLEVVHQAIIAGNTITLGSTDFALKQAIAPQLLPFIDPFKFELEDLGDRIKLFEAKATEKVTSKVDYVQLEQLTIGSVEARHVKTSYVNDNGITRMEPVTIHGDRIIAHITLQWYEQAALQLLTFSNTWEVYLLDTFVLPHIFSEWNLISLPGSEGGLHITGALVCEERTQKVAAGSQLVIKEIYVSDAKVVVEKDESTGQYAFVLQCVRVDVNPMGDTRTRLLQEIAKRGPPTASPGVLSRFMSFVRSALPKNLQEQKIEIQTNKPDTEEYNTAK